MCEVINNIINLILNMKLKKDLLFLRDDDYGSSLFRFVVVVVVVQVELFDKKLIEKNIFFFFIFNFSL